MKTAVIIPAYNSENTLASVIQDVRKELPNGTIIVIDDGSSDKTFDVAQACGALVLSHCQNLGKGAALKTGFAKALLLGVDFILTLDSDGQHRPYHIQDFFSVQENENADLIIGNRMHTLKNMPPHRILSNRTTSKLISLRINNEVPDSQCGYRLIRAELLREIELITSHFELESEIILKAGLADYRIASVAIDTVYATGSSAIHHVKDTFRFVILFFRSFFWY